MWRPYRGYGFAGFAQFAVRIEKVNNGYLVSMGHDVAPIRYVFPNYENMLRFFAENKEMVEQNLSLDSGSFEPVNPPLESPENGGREWKNKKK